MSTRDDLAVVRQAYVELRPPCKWAALGSGGGFSGASLWRITSAGSEYCLRRWPMDHPDERHLEFIHNVLHTAYQHGLREVALPLATQGGATWVRHAGLFWELTRWMPGRADYHAEPRPQKLRAALAWLATFHRATAPQRFDLAPSPAILERRQLLSRLAAGEASQLAHRLSGIAWPEFANRGRRILAAFQQRAAFDERLLRDVQGLACRLQPCIRDIWHDHVLFDNDRVSGVVDFGAMRVECVAGDIARLLGSLARDDAAQWRMGLAAYEEVRPLDANERRLLTAFDASGVLLSGMNWLRWICLENRQFEHPNQVIQRLDEVLLRLERPQALILE